MSYYAKRFFGQQGIVTDGLKLWLDASNLSSYPGTGTTWFDLSGNGNNGTMVNGVVPLSNAMQFDGVDDYVDFGNILNIGTGDFSYSLWTTLRATGLKGIFGKSIYGSVPGRWAIYQESDKIICMAQGIAASNISISQTPYINTGFHLFTVTINRAGNMILYIDGVQIASVVLTNPTYNMFTTGSLFAGAYGNSAGSAPQVSLYNNCDINDIMVYRKNLTTQEVQTIFNTQRSKYGI